MTDLRITVPTANVGRIDQAERRRRMALAIEANAPTAGLLLNKYAGQKLIICGGGPSIEQTLPDIKAQIRLSKRVKVMALNKTHDWLLKRGVTPDFGCMADPAPHVATYQTYQRGTVYLLGSTLHHTVFRRFYSKRNCFIWHPTNEDPITPENTDGGDKEWFAEHYPNAPAFRISGKSTVGQRSIQIAPLLGFTEIELHGYDSCDAPRVGHERKLYPYSKPNMEMSFKALDQVCNRDGSEFHYEANEHMARQSYEFFDMLENIYNGQRMGRMPKFKLSVAGDGAIPWMGWKINERGGIHATPDRMAAKYGDMKYYDYTNSKGSMYQEPTPYEGETVRNDIFEPVDFSIPLSAFKADKQLVTL